MEHAPDGWFYYAVTLAFGGALIYILLRYTSRIDSTLAKVQETLSDLKTMTQVHEQRLDGHDDDIADVKRMAFPVNYKRKP